MKSILSLLFFLLLTLPLLSQAGNEDDILIKQLDLSETITIDPSILSQAVIEQKGDFNNASIMQSNYGLQVNVAEIYQEGLNNNASINQTGSGNLSSARQTGNDNSYNLSISGDENRIFTEQTGNNNDVSQEVAAFGLRYLVTQNGNNLSFTQVENSPSSIPYEVKQTGNGMRIILINGTVK